MITVHLVRHGETIWHAEDRYAGSTDVAMTERGAAQADALTAWATTVPLRRIVSSDLSRARLTAGGAAHAAGLELRIDPDLREVHFGDAEGLTRDQMREQFLDAYEAFVRSPATSPLPSGETGEETVRRALRGLATATAGLADGDEVLIVAHTTLIRLVLCAVLGWPLDEYRRRMPKIDNVTLTTLSLPPEGWAPDAPPHAALLRFNAPFPGSAVEPTVARS